MRRATTGWLATAALASSLALPRTAAAEDAKDPIAPLDAELALYAEQAGDARLAAVAGSLAAGAFLVPTGIAMATRSDTTAQLLGVGLVVGGSVQLSAIPFAFIPTRMERLERHHRARKAAGMEGEALVRATEDEWRDAAASGQRARPFVAGTNLLLGLASAGVGIGFLLAQPGVAGMDRNTQYAWGSALLGAGVPFTIFGLRSLLLETPEETSWRLHVIPVPRGAAVGIGLAF